MTDAGVITVGETSFSNWLYSKRGGTDGRLGFVKALVRSNDIFFYRAAEETGPEEMATWARKMGLGEITGIEATGEVAGLIGDPAWKMKTKGERWFTGNTFHMGIGQGDILVTPVQVNVMTNILASGGKKCGLRMANTMLGREIECPRIEISTGTLEIVREGMIGACSEGGTSFVFFDWNAAALRELERATYARSLVGKALPIVACKTGTAEYVAPDGKTKTHAWLTAFAPADMPEISVTVVVEGGGEGSNVAAPVVRKIMAEDFGVEDRYPYGSIRGDGE